MKFSISKFLFFSKIIYARIDLISDVFSIDFEDNQKLVTVASSTATSEITEPLAHFPAGRIYPKENYFTFIIKRSQQMLFNFSPI